MKKTSVSLDDLRGVFSVPPLARKTDARRGFDRQENDRNNLAIPAAAILEEK